MAILQQLGEVIEHFVDEGDVVLALDKTVLERVYQVVLIQEEVDGIPSLPSKTRPATQVTEMGQPASRGSRFEDGADERQLPY